MARQRVSRVRLARRLTRRARWIVARSCRSGCAGRARRGRRRDRLAPHVAALRGHRGRGGGASRLTAEEIVAASGIGPGQQPLPARRAARWWRGVEALPLVRRAEVVRALPEPGHAGGGGAAALHPRPRGPAALDRRAGRDAWARRRARWRSHGPGDHRAEPPPTSRPRDGTPSARVAAGVSLLRTLLRSESRAAAADLGGRREPARRARCSTRWTASRCGWAAEDWEARLGRLAGRARPAARLGASRSSVDRPALPRSGRSENRGEVRRATWADPEGGRSSPGSTWGRPRSAASSPSGRPVGNLDIVGVGHEPVARACARAWWSTSTRRSSPSSRPSREAEEMAGVEIASRDRGRGRRAHPRRQQPRAWWRSPASTAR